MPDVKDDDSVFSDSAKRAIRRLSGREGIGTAVNKRRLAEERTRAIDTNSAEAQIAILTDRINRLTEHYKTNKKGDHSRRGLLAMVSQRRQLLDYVKGKDSTHYHEIIGKLGIRR